jgi:hypothetical protein
MKHRFFLILVGTLLLAPSCSKGEDEVSPSAASTAAGATSSATVPETAGEIVDSATAGEAPAGVAEEQTSKKASLRDQFKVGEAPPVEDLPWSTALTVEERMANLEETMSTTKEPYVVDMHDFGGWEFDEGKEQPFPAHVLALDGKKFTIRGFMMPDIDFEHIQKFHLVRSLFSCCFGAPPQLNEILRVTLADENGMDYTYNTVEVTGTLRVVFEMEDGLVEDLFRLENATYRIIDFDDPEAPSSFDAETGFGDMLPSADGEY